MAGPFAFGEAEVLTFTQRGGESLKDAWYRINDFQKKEPPRSNPLLSCLEIFMLGLLLGIGFF